MWGLADSSLQGLRSRYCSALRGLHPLLRGAHLWQSIVASLCCILLARHGLCLEHNGAAVQVPEGSLRLLRFCCSAGRRARQPAAQQVCLGPGHPLHCCSRPGHLAGAAALLEDGPHRAEGCCATGQSCSLRAPRWMCCTSQGCHAVVLALLPASRVG